MSTPRRRILIQTPEKGSPDLKRTRSMSPTLAESGLFLENRRVRDDRGSRMANCMAVKVTRGSGHFARVEGGGG